MNYKVCSLQKKRFRLNKTRPEQPINSVEIMDVAKTVCAKFNVPFDKLISKSRKRELVTPRKIAAFLAYQPVNKFSLKTIGSVLGGRDHTTMIHNRQSVVDMLQTSQTMREDISTLYKDIYGVPFTLKYKILS